MQPTLRMCLACRQLKDRRTMSRFVKTADGVIFDRSAKLDGRGAYLCERGECLDKLLKKKLLNKVFSCTVDEKVYREIAEDRLGKRQD